MKFEFIKDELKRAIESWLISKLVITTIQTFKEWQEERRNKK